MSISTITITRPFEWLNQTASNNIYIDGKKMGAITPGETIHYDVLSGKHTVWQQEAHGQAAAIQLK